MSKKRNINTILAQAGIKSDQATGALTTPLHFSTTYQHPEFGQSTGFDYTRTKNPTRATAEKTLAARKCRLCFGDKLWNVSHRACF